MRRRLAFILLGSLLLSFTHPLNPPGRVKAAPCSSATWSELNLYAPSSVVSGSSDSSVYLSAAVFTYAYEQNIYDGSCVTVLSSNSAFGGWTVNSVLKSTGASGYNLPIPAGSDGSFSVQFTLDPSPVYKNSAGVPLTGIAKTVNAYPGGVGDYADLNDYSNGSYLKSSQVVRPGVAVSLPGIITANVIRGTYDKMELGWDGKYYNSGEGTCVDSVTLGTPTGPSNVNITSSGAGGYTAKVQNNAFLGQRTISYPVTIRKMKIGSQNYEGYGDARTCEFDSSSVTPLSNSIFILPSYLKTFDVALEGAYYGVWESADTGAFSINAQGESFAKQLGQIGVGDGKVKFRAGGFVNHLGGGVTAPTGLVQWGVDKATVLPGSETAGYYLTNQLLPGNVGVARLTATYDPATVNIPVVINHGTELEPDYELSSAVQTAGADISVWSVRGDTPFDNSGICTSSSPLVNEQVPFKFVAYGPKQSFITNPALYWNNVAGSGAADASNGQTINQTKIAIPQSASFNASVAAYSSIDKAGPLPVSSYASLVKSVTDVAENTSSHKTFVFPPGSTGTPDWYDDNKLSATLSGIQAILNWAAHPMPLSSDQYLRLDINYLAPEGDPNSYGFVKLDVHSTQTSTVGALTVPTFHAVSYEASVCAKAARVIIEGDVYTGRDIKSSGIRFDSVGGIGNVEVLGAYGSISLGSGSTITQLPFYTFKSPDINFAYGSNALTHSLIYDRFRRIADPVVAKNGTPNPADERSLDRYTNSGVVLTSQNSETINSAFACDTLSSWKVCLKDHPIINATSAGITPATFYNNNQYYRTLVIRNQTLYLNPRRAPNGTLPLPFESDVLNAYTGLTGFSAGSCILSTSATQSPCNDITNPEGRSWVTDYYLELENVKVIGRGTLISTKGIKLTRSSSSQPAVDYGSIFTSDISTPDKLMQARQEEKTVLGLAALGPDLVYTGLDSDNPNIPVDATGGACAAQRLTANHWLPLVADRAIFDPCATSLEQELTATKVNVGGIDRPIARAFDLSGNTVGSGGAAKTSYGTFFAPLGTITTGSANANLDITGASIAAALQFIRPDGTRTFLHYDKLLSQLAPPGFSLLVSPTLADR